MFSEGCPVSGEICTAAAGQVARFFAGRTRGYHNPALMAEYVRDHLDRIRDESDSSPGTRRGDDPPAAEDHTPPMSRCPARLFRRITARPYPP